MTLLVALRSRNMRHTIHNTHAIDTLHKICFETLKSIHELKSDHHPPPTTVCHIPTPLNLFLRANPHHTYDTSQEKKPVQVDHSRVVPNKRTLPPRYLVSIIILIILIIPLFIFVFPIFLYPVLVRVPVDRREKEAVSCPCPLTRCSNIPRR